MPCNLRTMRGRQGNDSNTVARYLAHLTWALHTSGLAAMKIAEIGNLWYKFTPKGYIPLSDFTKFGVAEGVTRPHNHAKFRRCGFKNVGLEHPK